MYIFPKEGTVTSKLQAPFPSHEIEWRIQQSGVSNKDGRPWAMVLAYVSARAIQRRLDDVFGWDGWNVEYKQLQNGIICRLTVKREDGGQIFKEDGSPETDIESFKGGISGSLKRVAASGLGIGRYLYYLDSGFAETSLEFVKGWNKAKAKDTHFWWAPPAMPLWALPENKK